MQDKVFLDTNILIYAYSSSELEKQSKARLLFEKHNEINISKQVINEISNVLFNKFKLKFYEVETTILQINNITTTFDFDIATQVKAIKLKKDYNFQFYDALIVATALENRCNILYSEDMHDELVIDKQLTIINPFKDL
jgi:predicted nucleic acid-binding protein